MLTYRHEADGVSIDNLEFFASEASPDVAERKIDSVFPQGLESLCPGHSLLASCFKCQREGLILTASASTA